MAPFTRKGRNPGPVDEWLETLGYYRKNVAYDETCLFRSISEQLFSSQLFHEKIRKECIAYGRAHHNEFTKYISGKEDWEVRMNRLEKHMAICGRVEISLISKTYNKGIVLFDGVNLQIKELTGNEFEENLFICHMGEDHYDAVYYKSYIQDAGFCQSIVYNVLYENVFHIPKIVEIVETMLYHKPMLTYNGKGYTEDVNGNKERCSKRDYYRQNENVLRYDGTIEFKKCLGADNKEQQLNDYEYMLKTNLAPFPFKVAKALDPSIYRNIEYDTWTEMRKEMRLGDWYYGDNNLIEGSGCILNEHGSENHCYIQEILKNENAAIVFLTKMGEKRRVRLSDLRPEVDAKPWPLPYRFSKHLVISIPKLELPERKGFRKRREKKRTISKCSSTSEVAIEVSISDQSNNNLNVHTFEGAPLHQQMQPPQQLLTPKLEIAEAPVSMPLVENSPAPPPETNQVTYENGWQRNETIVWPPTPPVTQNVFTYNTMVPTSPDVYHHDHQGTYYPNEYQAYNIWPNGEFLPPLPTQNQIAQSPQTEIPITPDGFSYVFSDGSNYSPNYYPNNRGYQTALNSPQLEIFHPQPVYQSTIGTPVIIAPTTTEIIPTPSPLPHVSHVTMYSPAIEMPCSYYPPPSPFMFPPTPTQPTWYQAPPVNSQGFIFPTINVTPTSPAPVAQ
ncbi:protein ovarian tumor locus-like isoform X2 [Atheta coriaria]|uniref:protein ovarian tumor locus-like isoform X2 n=1 Tax=Dalotia coriaria TaxID=877792 RepID=UPI0031F408BA